MQTKVALEKNWPYLSGVFVEESVQKKDFLRSTIPIIHFPLN